MKNNKDKDLAAIKKIFKQFKVRFTFEQIKAIYVILLQYWQPSEGEYHCQLINWTKIGGQYESDMYSMEMNDISITQFTYSEEMLESTLSLIVTFINQYHEH